MVLAHIERRKQDKVDQVSTMRARFAPGNYPGPKPGPGVFATSSSVATPARLPDGRLSERSTPEILPVRELTGAGDHPEGDGPVSARSAAKRSPAVANESESSHDA